MANTDRIAQLQSEAAAHDAAHMQGIINYYVKAAEIQGRISERKLLLEQESQAKKPAKKAKPETPPK